ncbi:hypothetical protein CDD83_7754 [Cordyceps sp. RAO-2017]|nr:hypothetical protein CDD83_7754 [Cordyceps sp. RAO-2017]
MERLAHHVHAGADETRAFVADSLRQARHAIPSGRRRRTGHASLSAEEMRALTAGAEDRLAMAWGSLHRFFVGRLGRLPGPLPADAEDERWEERSEGLIRQR